MKASLVPNNEHQALSMSEAGGRGGQSQIDEPHLLGITGVNDDAQDMTTASLAQFLV